MTRSSLNSTVEIRSVRSGGAAMICWQVLKELRPHLVKESFTEMMDEMLREGYRLSYIEQDNMAVAAVGFRYLQFLHVGKHFYIDDLSTLPDYRGKGFAGLLIDHVVREAKARGCEAVTLDSGPARHDAHRLYLNKGFVISSHHFTKKLDQTDVN